MAYNTMSVTRQTPYIINNTTGFIKKKEDESEDLSSKSNSSQSKNENEDIYKNKNNNLQQQIVESEATQQKAIASRDANLKNATINIAQILKDFRCTVKAIGATPELIEEAEMYLRLVEKQVQKEDPDSKLVRSNLKNASSLLDNYISETLQRQSKVVENWIDALFLQQINYKFNGDEINPQFLVKFPGQHKDEEENQQDENEDKNQNAKDDSQNNKKSVNIPQDEKLKSLFIKAKKFSCINDFSKAMELFKEALDRAIEISDSDTESKILFEIGKIYDKNDYLAQALTSYNKSLTVSGDFNIKTKAHYSMAQIYDDVAQFESAINHYMSSISYAGETENLTAQSTSLVKIGNIYADGYKNEAFNFLEEAEFIALESNDSKTKGFVSGSIANAYNKFNKPKNALKYYACAVEEYQGAQQPIKVAINYKRAAELMQDYKNIPKAKILFKKALAKARQTEDVQLMKEIHEALNIL